MREELISFEVAKLAKEKGFDLNTLHFYTKNSTCNYLEIPYKYTHEVNANKKGDNNFGYGLTWSAPSQSLLLKWLREVHNIIIWLIPTIKENDINCFQSFASEGHPSSGGLIKCRSKHNLTYELALENALEQGLSLIITI